MNKTTRITYLAAAIISISTAAKADTDQGAYIGVGIGLYQTDLNFKATNVDFSLGDTKHDGGADVFVGYKLKFGENSAGHLGIELGYNGSYGKLSTWTVGTGTINGKLENSKEISVLPGFSFTKETSGFVRLGYAQTKATLTLGATINGVAYSQSDSQNFSGPVWGIGVDHSVSKNVGLRGEYKVADFKERSFNTVTYTPRAAGVNLALRYAF
jgi:opacity protein-like surface antigen